MFVFIILFVVALLPFSLKHPYAMLMFAFILESLCKPDELVLHESITRLYVTSSYISLVLWLEKQNNCHFVLWSPDGNFLPAIRACSRVKSSSQFTVVFASFFAYKSAFSWRRILCVNVSSFSMLGCAKVSRCEKGKCIEDLLIWSLEFTQLFFMISVRKLWSWYLFDELTPCCN